MLQFTTKSATLKRVLADINKAIDPKSCNKILQSFHVSMDNTGRVTIKATDNSIAMCKTIQADKWQGSGVFCVDASLLLASLSGSSLDVTLTYDKALKIEEYGCEISFEGNNAGEYPVTAKREEATSTLYIDGKLLKEGISRVRHCLAKDDLRPVMTGVCMETKDGNVTFFGTDGRMLSMKPIKAEFQCKDFIALLSAKLSNILCSTINDKDKVKVQVTGTHIYLDYDGMMLDAKLIEGKAPNYRGVIPQCPNRMTLLKDMLIGKLRLVSQFTIGSGLCALEIKDGRLYLSAKDDDMFGKSIHDSMPIEDSSSDDSTFPSQYKVGVNAPILIKTLQAFSESKVEINFIEDASRAIVLTGDGSTNLIMPMLLNDEKPQEESKEEETEEQEIEEEVA